MKVAIAGGGIGGLTAALCLAQRGHSIIVCEQASQISEVGAGIQLSPNAMRVLRKLGLEDALKAKGFAPQALEMRDGHFGTTIFKAQLEQGSDNRWRAPYLNIHRSELIDILKSAFEEYAPGSTKLGTKVAAYSLTGDRPSLVLEGDDPIEADAIIGADGIHSILREQMLGPSAPRFTGNVAWRLTVNASLLGDNLPPPTACVWVGPGKHVVTYRLGDGGLINLVGVVEQAQPDTEHWTNQGSKEEALTDFNGWHPTITNVLKNGAQFYKWALFDRAPLSHWSDGPVTLLGDACHPMLPFVAQGAAMAIEDAWVLAHHLDTGSSVQHAMIEYENARLSRVTKIQAAARKRMNTFHKSGALSRLATYGPMWAAGKIIPHAIHASQDWIYGYDVTALYP